MNPRSRLSAAAVAALLMWSGGVASGEGFTPADHEVTEVAIPMADGGSLAADVYLPGDGEYPTVLAITMGANPRA
jgi:predicted acyl esterase